MTDAINWIPHTGNVAPVSPEAVIHVMTTIDRHPCLDVQASGIKPAAWTQEGTQLPSGEMGRITHYAVADKQDNSTAL